MKCPVCHSDATDFLAVTEVPASFHEILNTSSDGWRESLGICMRCIDALDVKTDQALQEILNGSIETSRTDTSFAYVLTLQEQFFWTHLDRSIQDWHHAEIRNKVCALARAKNHCSWTIFGADIAPLDSGEIPNQV
jgi:hypothetical protein